MQIGTVSLWPLKYYHCQVSNVMLIALRMRLGIEIIHTHIQANNLTHSPPSWSYQNPCHRLAVILSCLDCCTLCWQDFLNSSFTSFERFKCVLISSFSRPPHALMLPHSWLNWCCFRYHQRIDHQISPIRCNVVSDTAMPCVSDLLHLFMPSLPLRSSADLITCQIPEWKKRLNSFTLFTM